MTIYHFEFGKLGRGLSGGENCLIQLIKVFRERGISNVLLTTDNARAEYESLGLCEDALLEYRTIDSEWTERRCGAFGSYVVRTFMASRLVHRVSPQPGDILLCNSDFFPNSIPFHRVAGRHPETRLVYWLRMLAPDWFRGFEGHYTGRRKLPSPRFVHYKLAQSLYLRLLRPRGTVFVQNTDFERRLRSKRPDLKVHTVSRYPGKPGLDFDPLAVPKHYDLAWMGRFHAQKGLFELVDILRFLKAKRPGVSLLLLGGGSEKIKHKFFKRCASAGVADHIHHAGYGGANRLELLSGARLFLLTSYYEGSPNVAMEALTCGLPVVCYDLPIYSAFEGATRAVPPRDNAALARVIEDLLADYVALRAEQERATAFSRSCSWQAVADELLMIASGSAAGKG